MKPLKKLETKNKETLEQQYKSVVESLVKEELKVISVPFGVVILCYK